jgi:hydrogenase maturation protein HypF
MTAVTGRRVFVEGVVQGVGFRPFVFMLATRHGLSGRVRNTASGVEMEIEGADEQVRAFLQGLRDEAPPLACIDEIRAEFLEPSGYRHFRIDESQNGDGFQPISPDVATCAECMREVMDPGDRRYHYPFTNCTNCGPRFTIIRATPYDRPNTTMAGFTMCARCRAEYDDPRDRRFHAQPNACPECGPRLTLVSANGTEIAGDPIETTRRILAGGQIVAIKGIGGFHLACDASNEAAVARLRDRKGREAKPLALMVRDLATADRVCLVTGEDRALLTSLARPIVLMGERSGSELARSVAPGLGWVGLMLPYAPLHQILFEDGCPAVLVVTSGNRGDEPIATDDADAMARLSSIADAFLLHDRPIHVRCDDSVTRVVDGSEMPIRRSRGYAPFPVRLPFEARPILACGAELKNTICLTRGTYAFLSPHIGDLENYDTFVSYGEMVERMEALFRVRPEAVAHDLHPDYLSTRFALSFAPTIPRVAVQHHHAHVGACMAEHRIDGPVIGVAFDGTGYGTDGCIWGGEFLVAGYTGFTRAAHLGYVAMPGGDRAVREPFRMALAHLMNAFGRWDPALPPVRESSEDERRAVALQIERGLNAPPASSVGRLFDAVASIIGLRHRVCYEGQAAMELEARVDPTAKGTYPVVLSGERPIVIDPAPIVRGVVEDIAAGAKVPAIAARFHATIARAIVRVCERIRAATGVQRVVLSGGVFQNVTLLTAARKGLTEAGFQVFCHRLVPPNDAAICLGQAAIAHARLTGGADMLSDFMEGPLLSGIRAG